MGYVRKAKKLQEEETKRVKKSKAVKVKQRKSKVLQDSELLTRRRK